MILIKKIKCLDPNRCYVLADFDRTITAHDSSTTWGLLQENPFVDSGYVNESLSLYRKYRPIELNYDMPFDEKAKHMETWYEEIAGLLNKYHIYKDSIDRILANSNGLKLRKGALNFLERMRMLGVPVIIVSAGLGDFAVKYLQAQNISFDNITINANFLVFDDNGQVVSIKQPIIHSLNKGQLDYSKIIGGRDTGLLFGDQIEDMEMSRGLETINVGFCNPAIHDLKLYQSSFDIVLTGNSSYDEIAPVLIKGYK